MTPHITTPNTYTTMLTISDLKNQGFELNQEEMQNVDGGWRRTAPIKIKVTNVSYLSMPVSTFVQNPITLPNGRVVNVRGDEIE